VVIVIFVKKLLNCIIQNNNLIKSIKHQKRKYINIHKIILTASFTMNKRVIVSYILFCLINSIDCRTCIQSKLTESFNLNSFNESQFKNTIDNMTSKDNVHGGKCYAAIDIDYTNHRLNIQFPRRSDQINEITMRFLSVPQLLTNQTVLLSILYTCLDVDYCNRDYILKQIPYMIVIDYDEIQKKLFQLLTKVQNGKLSCYFNAGSHSQGYCKSKLCVAEERSNGKLEGSCGSEKSSLIEVNLLSRKKQYNIDELVKYICDFDYCNDNEIFTKIKNTVRKFQQYLSKFFYTPEQVATLSPRSTYAYTRMRIDHSPDPKTNNAIIQTKTFILLSLSLVLHILLK